MMSKQQLIWLGAASVGAAALVAIWSGAGRPAALAQGGPKGLPAPPPAVTISKPVVRELTEWDEYTGRFDSMEAVDIRARVSGYLDKVMFRDGQQVKKGAPLYRIDPRPFERALDQARAELEQAKTKVGNSMRDVDRGRPLADRKIISEKTQDDRENLMREAQSAVKVAEAKIALAELDLSFTAIAAPISGRLSRSNITQGNWINAGNAAGPTLLTTIVSEDPIFVYFDVSENNFIKYMRMGENGLKAGMSELGAPVELGLPDETGFPHKGRLDFIDNRLDAATATLRARAIVDNGKRTFSAGMFARVRVTGSASYAAILLPDDAIGTDQSSKFVLTVAEDGTVSRKVVQLGPLAGALRIIRAGITVDDWVVTRGLQRARPGGKVTPKREPIQVSEAESAAAPSKQ